tara:strand:+ start:1187 stop:2452 length:1266 start_codon:yes stop_codon:yes gene_type:complete
MKLKTLILLLILLLLIYLCFINTSPLCICKYEKFKNNSNNNNYINKNINIGSRQYVQTIFNSNDNDDNNPIECDLLILYYHGYKNFPSCAPPCPSTDSYIPSISKFCKNYKEKKIVLARLLGDTYNGWTSWNITDYGNGNDIKNSNIGSGYGNNTENISTCSLPKSKAIVGGNGKNELGTNCNKSLKTNGCRWTSCSNDVSFTKQVIKNYNANKVCALGFSTGAMFVYTLPNYIPDIKTIVTFAGNIPFGLVVPKEGTNILDFHGNNDPTVPGISSASKNLSNCNLNIQLEKYMKTYLINNEYMKNGNINKHYTCDDDANHRYLYHHTADLLKKISGSSSYKKYEYNDLKTNNSLKNLKNVLHNSINDINDNDSNITNIFKFNENIYSIEWDGKHGIPNIKSKDNINSIPFNMAIDYFMKI